MTATPNICKFEPVKKGAWMRGGDHIEKFPRRLDLGEETRCNQQISESGQFPIPDDVISKCNLILILILDKIGTYGTWRSKGDVLFNRSPIFTKTQFSSLELLEIKTWMIFCVGNLQTVSPTYLRSCQHVCIYCNGRIFCFQPNICLGEASHCEVAEASLLQMCTPPCKIIFIDVQSPNPVPPAKIIFIRQPTPSMLCPNEVLSEKVKTSAFTLTHGMPN